MHKDITTLRESIASKRAELRHLQSGEVRAPLAVALARVDELLAAQAREAEGHIQALVAELTLAGRATPARLVDSRDHRALQSLLVALLPDIGDAIKDRVRGAYGSDENGISPAELPARIASLEAELLTLEVRDVELSAKHGEAPRPGTDPRALLGIAA